MRIRVERSWVQGQGVVRRPVMPEFARLRQEFWAAVTYHGSRGVSYGVERPVPIVRPQLPDGAPTTYLDGPVGARPRVSAIFTTSPTPSAEELASARRAARTGWPSVVEPGARD